MIESLKPYAGNPPSDSPPEILPWEEDRWGLLDAAKSALALLVEGEPPGDQSGFSISNGLGTNPHKLLKGNNLGRINYIHISSILIKVQLKTVKQSQHFLYGGFIGEIL